MTRKELYKFITDNNLQDDCFSIFGKNFTNVSNALLEDFCRVINETKNLQGKKEDLRASLITTLYACFDNDVINVDQFNGIRGILDASGYSLDYNDTYVKADDYNELEDKYNELVDAVASMMASITNENLAIDIQSKIDDFEEIKKSVK